MMWQARNGRYTVIALFVWLMMVLTEKTPLLDPLSFGLENPSHVYIVKNCEFKFRDLWQPRKFCNNKNFLIYGI